MSVECLTRLERALRPSNFRYIQRTLSMAPILVGLFVLYMLGFSSQIHEVYLTVLEGDWTSGLTGIAITGLVSVLLFAWHHDFATNLMDRDYNLHGDPLLDTYLCRLRDAKCLVLAAMPSVGVACGLWSAYRELAEAGSTTSTIGRLRSAVDPAMREFAQRAVELPTNTIWMVPVAIVTLGGILVWLWWSSRQDRNRRRWMTQLVRASWGVCIVLVVMGTFSQTYAASLARSIGSFAVFGLIVVCLVAILSFATYVAKLFLPFFLVAIIGMLGWQTYAQVSDDSAGDLASAAQAPPVSTATRPPEKERRLTDEFDTWLAPRRAAYAGRPVPVFIFAAQGGGIYAASAIATLLARLEDRCPGFSRQIFAISGVSGGAVGTAIFNSLVQARPVVEAPCKVLAPGRSESITREVQRVIRKDHLAPVGAMVVPDLLAKVFTGGSVRVGGARPTALENSLLDALGQVSAKARSAAEAQHKAGWLAKDGAGLPAPILNTTWVETGFRVAFAPFPLRATGEGTLYSFQDAYFKKNFTKEIDSVGFLRAALISARFPGAMPAWSLENKEERLNFVDGGYADASGVTTALEVYQQLKRHINPRQVDLRLVILTENPPQFDLSLVPAGTKFSDLVAPVAALLNVRSLLSQNAVTSAARQLTSADGFDESVLTTAISGQTEMRSSLLVVRLNLSEFPLVLGWTISDFSNSRIRLMLGERELCALASKIDAKPTGAPLSPAQATIVANSCVQNRLLSLVAPPRP